MLLRAVAWPRSAVPALAIVMPLRCGFLAPQLPRDTGPSAAQPKREEAPGRVSSAPPPARGRAASSEAIELPEEVVMRAVGVGQPAFLRCWARAQRLDAATQIASKVRVRLEVDATGKVSSVQTDSESPVLARCVGVVARQLAFPAPGRPAVVELPLIFR
ncbi:MAG TPA: hypothetical protein VLM79_22140 [Kofleriaceae bacterium]|nr:hypothetical protein [Kofleriaceae bacterium]